MDGSNKKEERLKYEGRDGAAGMSGQLYEIKLAMNFLLRGLIAVEKKEIDHFFLGTNVNDVHGFDDLIFKYVKNNYSKIILIQSKHKDKGTKITTNKLLSDVTKNVDYNMKSYLNCYNKNKLIFSKTNDPVLKDGFEHSDFILFSNASLIIDGDVSTITTNIEDIIGFSKNPGIKLMNDEIINKKVFDVLKIPFDFSKIIEEMIDWVKTNKIFTGRQIYQSYKKHIEDFIIIVQKDKGSFRKEFLEGNSSLPNELQILRKEFLMVMNTKKLEPKQGSMIVENANKKILSIEFEENFLTEISTNDISQFLNQFTLCFDQLSESQLEKSIKDQIRVHFNVTVGEATIIYNNLYSKVQNWWKSGYYYLTENDNWLAESIKTTELFNTTNLIKNHLRGIGLVYQNTKILNDKISQSAFINIVIPESTKILYHSIVYQVLNEMNIDYILLDFESFEKVQETVFNVFENTSDLLAITDIKSFNSKEICERLFTIVNNNPGKKLILIGDKIENHYPMEIVEILSVGFHNLTVCAQQKILNEVKVRFQGELLPLETVISPKLTYAIDEEMLARLFDKNNLVIGKKMRDLGKIKPHHIPRILKRHIVINQNCLGDATNNYALSGDYSGLHSNGKMFELNDYPNVYFMRNPLEEYEELSKNHLIHWLRCDKNRLIWVKSNCDLDNLRQHIDKDNVLRLTPEEVLKDQNKFSIITGEPGIGKSTLLSSMTDARIDLLWKYRIDLVDHSEKLKNKKRVNPLAFLREACDMSRLEFELFSANFEREGNIILLFDGFDEISPVYKEVVLNFFKELIKSKVKKVCVTTRLSMKDDLEYRLNTFAYHLEAFTVDDCKRFLKLFWKSDEQAIDRIICKFSNAINDQIRQFTSTPLQLKMLVEVYDELPADEALNLPKIYDRFFEKKFFDIQWKEKGKIDLNNAVINKPIRDSFNLAKKEYEYLAIFALYEEHLPLLFSLREIDEIKELIEKNVSGGKEKTGIINSIVDGKPLFVHRTYAEYFAAACLVRAHEKGISLKNFLLAIDFFNSNQITMRRFFDFALCGQDEIFNATLNNDLKKVESLIGTINARDRGGRTALHLVASYDFRSVARMILLKEIDVSPLDEIFSWTPLCYADRSHCWNIVGRLLVRGAYHADLCEAKKSILGCSDGDYSLIHICSESNYYKLLEFVLKIRPECVNYGARVKSNKTPLHLAIKNYNFNVLKLLLAVKGCQFKCDDNGYTILHEASRNNAINFVRFLTQNYKELNVNALDKTGRTPLQIAVELGNCAVSKILIEQGSKLNNLVYNDLIIQATKKDYTLIKQFLLDNKDKLLQQKDNFIEEDTYQIFEKLLGVAIKENNLKKVIEIFEEKDRSIDKTNTMSNLFIVPHSSYIHCKDPGLKWNNIFPFLDYAIEHDYLQILEYFLSKASNVEPIINEKGVSILHAAAFHGKLETIKYLIKLEYDPLIKDDRGQTSLFYATKNGHLEILEYFISFNAKWKDIVANDGSTLLHCAAEFGKIKIVFYLLELGADPIARDYNGRTSLHFASQNGYLDILKHFLSLNKDWRGVTSCEGATPLSLAAEHGVVDTYKYLFELEADPIVKNKNGKIDLHSAIENGHVDIVKYLLTVNENWINETFEEGNTFLHIAAEFGTVKIIKHLFELKADPLARNFAGWTPLHCAIRGKKLDIVKYYLSINTEWKYARTDDGSTLIHLASANGFMEIIMYLLEIGSSPAAKDNRGFTPLHLACINGQGDILKYFISLNPKHVHVKSYLGDTLLHVTAEFDMIELVEYLLEHGVDPEANDNDGYTFLHYLVLNGQLDYLKHLISLNNDWINLKSDKGITMLHLAARISRIDMIEYFMTQGFDPMTMDNNHLTSLHYAASIECLENLKYFQSKNPNWLHAKNDKGVTPLHIAAKHGRMEVVQYLLNNKVDPVAKDNDGFTPLHLATMRGHYDVLECIISLDESYSKLETTKKETLLHLAAEAGVMKIVEYLLKLGANPIAKDTTGWTSLHCSIRGGHLEILKHFLSLNKKWMHLKTDDGLTLLHLAGRFGKTNIVLYLLDNNADPEETDNNGHTPLHSAIIGGHLDILQHFLSFDPDYINLVADEEDEDSTLLHTAVKFNQLEIVNYLLGNGALPGISKTNGLTFVTGLCD